MRRARHPQSDHGNSEMTKRNISVIVDNDSWVLPYAEKIVGQSATGGHNAILVRNYADVPQGDIAFYLGCLKITPPDILARNKRNLVVHASDLPKGRGFSPWTYAILEGENKIPVCLIEAAEEVDSGPVIYKEFISLAGNELVGEIRALIGKKTVELCTRFINEKTLPEGKEQQGEASVYSRRRPEDSAFDPERSIADQFDLLRVVDNINYPAFFEYRGRRYKLLIEPDDRDLKIK